MKCLDRGRDWTRAIGGSQEVCIHCVVLRGDLVVKLLLEFDGTSKFLDVFSDLHLFMLDVLNHLNKWPKDRGFCLWNDCKALWGEFVFLGV